MDSFSEGLIHNAESSNSKQQEFTDLDEIITVENEINRLSTSKQVEAPVDTVDLKQDEHANTSEMQPSKSGDAKKMDEDTAAISSKNEIKKRKGIEMLIKRITSITLLFILPIFIILCK